jgi:hypothetical protein
MLEMVVQRSRRRNQTGNVSLRYVEDIGEPRTTLAAIEVERLLMPQHGLNPGRRLLKSSSGKAAGSLAD